MDRDFYEAMFWLFASLGLGRLIVDIVKSKRNGSGRSTDRKEEKSSKEESK